MGRLLPISVNPMALKLCTQKSVLILLLSLLLSSCARATAPQQTAASVIPSATAPSPATSTVAPPTATLLVPTATATALPAATPTQSEATPTAIPTVAAAPVVFVIDPAQTVARFSINESLFGDPKNVVGQTSDVQGVITITVGNSASTQIGLIRINARDLHTDEEMRDRAIRTFILESSQDDYQFITFMPTQIEGLPAQVQDGATISFTVTGDMKIRNVVKPVTFALSVTPKGSTEISGLARATITRTAFELSIPSVPGVADVTDEIGVAFEFVAKKQ